MFASLWSELKLARAHKGILACALHLTGQPLPGRQGTIQTHLISGRSASSSTPDRGENAILKALAELRDATACILVSIRGGDAINKVPAQCTITFLGADTTTTLSHCLDPALLVALSAFVNGLTTLVTDFSDNEPEFSSPTLTTNIGKIHAEHDTAWLEFDLRPLPSQYVERLLARLTGCIESLQSAGNISAHLNVKRHNPAFSTAYDASILTTALTVLADVGLPLDITTKADCTEAGVYSQHGTPALVCGEGA